MQIRKKAFCLLIATAIIFTGTAYHTANADTASSWTTKTVNGRTYKFNSEVWNRYFTSGHTVEAVAQVRTADEKNAKTGYMGAQARLYTEGGTLKKSSSFVYNDVPVVNIYAYSPRATSTNIYFYSQSKIKLYNGNGYTTYTANKSPNCKVKSFALAISDDIEEFSITTFKENDEELSYGSGLQVDEQGDEPDLIAAIGINNKNGYIKSADLNPQTTSPEEACEVNRDLKSAYSIPVYDLEGNVIDQFIVGE